MTTAYNIIYRNGKLNTSQTTFPMDKCHEPEAALEIVRKGQMATVAGSKVTAFRKLWDESKLS